MNNNPWTEITQYKRVLEIDQVAIDNHNSKYEKDERKISILDYPEPFLGNPNASIYILVGNPGRDIENEKSISEFVDKNNLQHIILQNLKHDFANIDYPFYFLDPKFEKHPGSKWWNNAWKKVIKDDEYIRKVIAREIFEIELYGYHSVKCEKNLVNSKINKLKSPEYSYQLIRKAISENKLILLARATGAWFERVPELKNYKNCHFVASNRGIVFSENTISPVAYLHLQNIIKKFVTISNIDDSSNIS